MSLWSVCAQDEITTIALKITSISGIRVFYQAAEEYENRMFLNGSKATMRPILVPPIKAKQKFPIRCKAVVVTLLIECGKHSKSQNGGSLGTVFQRWDFLWDMISIDQLTKHFNKMPIIVIHKSNPLL